jgi:hypothetical protein
MAHTWTHTHTDNSEGILEVHGSQLKEFSMLYLEWLEQQNKSYRVGL